MLRCFALLVASLLLSLAAPVQAQLTAHFYARDFGSHYPHALVHIDGRLASGQRVAVNYGFTARAVTRDVLARPVPGYVQTLDAAGMATMERQFSVAIDDAAYRRLLTRVAAWQRQRQPAYDLNARNCVHFVMDMAAALGLKVNRRSAHFQLPRRFLDELRALNRGMR
jgi:hypothetical protein